MIQRIDHRLYEEADKYSPVISTIYEGLIDRLNSWINEYDD